LNEAVFSSLSVVTPGLTEARTTSTRTLLSAETASVATSGMGEVEITSSETVLSPSSSSIETIKSCSL
jgi:hypothetical protein